GQFSPRMIPLWPDRLLSYYIVSNLVFCPDDRTREVDRSYLVNGFDDWFKSNLVGSNYDSFLNHTWPEGMKESAIRDSTDTLLFGEKTENSHNFHVDIDLNDHNIWVEGSAHGCGRKGKGGGGGSNYVFADGGVRHLTYPKAINPINLWSITDGCRTNISAG